LKYIDYLWQRINIIRDKHIIDFPMTTEVVERHIRNERMRPWLKEEMLEKKRRTRNQKQRKIRKKRIRNERKNKMV